MDKKIRRLLPTNFLVGVTGFEPAASWSRTKRSTELSHTPKEIYSVLVCTNGGVSTIESAPLLSYGLTALRIIPLAESKIRSVIYTELSHTPKKIYSVLVCTNGGVSTIESAPLLSYGLTALRIIPLAESKIRSVIYTELSHTQIFRLRKINCFRL